MGRAQVKREVLKLLHSTSTPLSPKVLDRYKGSMLLGPLFSALCSNNARVRWFAVSAFGYIVPKIAQQDIEEARIVMRRFLWSLNDESGGIGWGAPEAMAEIMCRDDRLRTEYLHMLISYMRGDGEELHQDGNYLELPMLQRGLLWGIGRLCETHCDEMKSRNIGSDLMSYLESEDLYVVGHALRALAFLSLPVQGELVKKHLSSTETLKVFIREKFVEIELSELVAKCAV